MSDTLVVYFSRKGYTRRAAEERARLEGADILELKTKERTSGILGFWWCGRFGMNRMDMPLEPYDTDVSAYKRVIVVSPIWVFTACAPVRAFARAESGRVSAASYVFLHFSPFMHYGKTVASLNELMGATSDGYESVVCVLGRFLLARKYKTLSNS